MSGEPTTLPSPCEIGEDFKAEADGEHVSVAICSWPSGWNGVFLDKPEVAELALWLGRWMDQPVADASSMIALKRGVWEWTHPNPRRAYDSDAGIEMTSGDHGLTISITDDHAVDGYNAEFTTELTMPREVVRHLHAWLGEMLSDD